uniref:IkappaB kinase n=1 Tax=Sphaeramia orbicularis TaxID=375764 RepID=A0A673ALN1_9TELE
MTYCFYLFQDTEEQIAIKQCRQELSERNKERWCLEIQIMRRLNHVSVVAAREVPAGMHKLLANNDLPLLAMEYCQGGDLRKLGNRMDPGQETSSIYPTLILHNSFPLALNPPFCLFCFLASALTYLHKMRIIHRDLKPENIVLQQGEKRLIHKIIDLGYAKELDHSSLCVSFVGTLQYLAPELIERQRYTVSVDYWSFGTLVFECITGFRPFLPTWQPVPWHNKLRLKQDDDIVVYEDLLGEVRFSKHLPQPNNLSSLLSEKLESWLKLMLKWSPQERGKDKNATPSNCFAQLELILQLKLVHVLNMMSAKTLIYSVSDQETVADLQLRIEKDTNIPAANQELLLEAGLALEPQGLAIQCAIDYAVMSNNDTLYLHSIPNITVLLLFCPHLPVCLCLIENDPEHTLPYSPLRRTCGQAWHTIRSLKEDWQRLQQGQKAAIMSLLRHNSSLSRQKIDMVCMHQRLVAKLDFFTTSLHIDMDKYQEQTATGIGRSLPWRCSANSERNPEVWTLQAHFNSTSVKCSLENKLNDSLFLCLVCSEQRCSGDSREVVRLVVQAVQFYERKLRDFYTHLSKTAGCRQRVMELIPKVEGVIEKMAESERVLMNLQEKRQRELWNLLKVACSKVRSPVSGSPDGLRTPSSVPPLLTPRHSLQQL